MRPNRGSSLSRLRRLAFPVAAATLANLGASGGAAQSARPLTVQQMKSDIAEFRRSVFSRDRSFSPGARKAATELLTRLESGLDTVAPVTFELTLARVVALADNGHTMSFPGPRSRRYNRVPIRLVPLDGAFRVFRATSATADLLGARLEAVDGRPIVALADAARAWFGGTTERRDNFVPYLLESPEQLHAIGLAREAPAASYSFVLPDGRTVERQLEGAPPDASAPRGNTDRWLFPELLDSEAGTWRALLTLERAPWSLVEPDALFRSRRAPELQAVVVQFRANRSVDGQSIRDFMQGVTKEIESARPRHVVLDMRFNGGGDLNTTRDFMKRLPALVPGRIFVLTSGWTFSAGISSVGYLKQEAPERVTIVGEPVGDRLRMFAEGGPVTLPNSGAVISMATERHDYVTGCRGFADCHGAVVRHPIAVPTLAPDLPVPWTFEAYAAGGDPAMEAVARAIGVPTPSRD